jgi:hypothetical protein
MAMPKYKGGMGFRDIEIFNLALLARQAWRVLQDPDSLSARMLKAVYFPNTDILSATLGANPSQIWRALYEGREVLKHGLIKRIGDGRSTSVWDDNWIPRDFSLRPVCAKQRNPPQRVCDLMCAATRTWNSEALNHHLLPMDVEMVKQIPLSYTIQQDSWAWHYERNGVFSVRSAHKMLAETKHRRENWLEKRAGSSCMEGQEKQWKKLWQTRVPSKLRIFAWRLARSSLPTGQERMHRHMATTSACTLCSASLDDWRHSLVECNLARAVWALMDENLVEAMQMDETTDPKLWLMSLCTTLSQRDFIQVLQTLWSIWWARRRAIHEEEFQSPLSTRLFITRYLDELKWTPQSDKTTRGIIKPASSAWIRPPAGCMKLNVDGAVAKSTAKGAVGVVCRNGGMLRCSPLSEVEGSY